ncbi:glycosyltransferase family 4 protein [bacterium]|nr:glycosyltransferase family 4 protein [candidate division CSSED10-310 bacterium]
MKKKVPLRYHHIEPSVIPIDRPPRIIICAVQIPFVKGGAEKHIDSLYQELLRRNFDVDVVRIPFKWYPPRQILNDALAWRFIDLTQSNGLPVDLVITTRFPSYCLRHPRKIAWVLHQHRQVYDLLNTEYSDFHDTTDDDHVRGLIYELDRRSLNECRKVFGNSQNVSQRMKKFLGIESEPLYHPPPLLGKYRCEEYGSFLLVVGRLEANKRVDLVVKALAETKNPIHLKIAGQGPQMSQLKTLAQDLSVSERIEFLGYVPDEALLDLYAHCGAVVYVPLDEDYGYITLEAFHSGKTVITTQDAGGVLEFVSDGESGIVSEANPSSLSHAMDRWFSLSDQGRSLAEKGYSNIKSITWDYVIDRLTEQLRKSRSISRSGTV